MDKKYLREGWKYYDIKEHANKIIEHQADSVVFKSDNASNTIFTLMVRIAQLEEDNKTLGAIICYDKKRLEKLEKANKLLGDFVQGGCW